MSVNLENLDPESRKILERAMSMESSTHAMGIDQVRAAEQRQLAEDMERKNAEARRRRGAAISGESAEQISQFKQMPIRGRKKAYASAKKDIGTQEKILPTQQLPDETGVVGGIDSNAMRNAFAKISGTGAMSEQSRGYGMDDMSNTGPSVEPGFHSETIVRKDSFGEITGNPGYATDTSEPSKSDTEHPVVKVVEQNVTDRPFDFIDGDHDYDAFTRITRLPSKGLFYKQELYGQALKLIDNYILNDIVDDGADSRDAVNVILERRVKGIMPEDILTIDETYILHWLRASSFTTHGMNHPGYECPSCGFNTDSDPMFNDLRIGFRQLSFELGKDIDALYALHGSKGYHVGTLGDGRECHVYLHRIRHANMLNEYIREWEQLHGTTMPGYVRSIVGLATIVEIEGIESEDIYSRMGEKVDYISEMPIPMRSVFENLIIEGTTSCKIYASVTCPKCGGVVKTPYPFLVPRYLSGF